MYGIEEDGRLVAPGNLTPFRDTRPMSACSSTRPPGAAAWPGRSRGWVVPEHIECSER